MMKVVIGLFMLACLGACTQTTKVTGDQAQTDSATNIPVAEQSCYVYTKGKDTAELTLMTTGIVSTGELKYKWFEKDQNMGTIEGEMHGDTLIATYTFNSEGQKSVRQVAFLKKGNQLLEGFGEIEEKDGQTRFKDLKKIDFSQALVFEKIACK
ncbi:hypothetical protein [Pedobacter nanyangensis]|uniref:hypothetical protein n=1 Tax=Pedobacter nanyangensis TaxID=1562389 RepID=UPI0013B3912F|nr:hypothetical protein [Pedobacter nanyangensis]